MHSSFLNTNFKLEAAHVTVNKTLKEIMVHDLVIKRTDINRSLKILCRMKDTLQNKIGTA